MFPRRQAHRRYRGRRVPRHRYGEQRHYQREVADRRIVHGVIGEDQDHGDDQHADRTAASKQLDQGQNQDDCVGRGLTEREPGSVATVTRMVSTAASTTTTATSIVTGRFHHGSPEGRAAIGKPYKRIDPPSSTGGGSGRYTAGGSSAFAEQVLHEGVQFLGVDG